MSSAAQRSPRGPGRPAGSEPGRTRAGLLAAARELMAEKGLPRVTTREVAERAGLNPGLVRYYFGGKDGLLRAVVEEIAQESQARTQRWAAGEGDARARLRGLVASMVRGFFDDPYAPRLFSEQIFFAEDDVVDRFVDQFGRTHIDALRAVLEDGRRSGEFRDVDPELAIPAVTGACIFLFLAAPVFDRVFERGALTPERVERFSESVAALVLDGIARPADPA